MSGRPGTCFGAEGISTMKKLARFLPALLALLLVALALGLTGLSADDLKVSILEWDVPTPNARPHDPEASPDGSLWVHGAACEQTRSPRSQDRRHQGVRAENARVRAARPGRRQGRQHLVHGELQGVHREARSQDGRRHRVQDARRARPRSPQPRVRSRRAHLLHGAAEQFRREAGSRPGQGRFERGSNGRSAAVRDHRRAGRSRLLLRVRSNKLGRIDPKTFEIREFPLPAGARPRRLTNNPDGLIYYSDFAREFLGRLDPRTAKVEEWASPGGPGSQPYGIASTRDGSVWYSESGVKPNTLVVLDPKTGSTRPLADTLRRRCRAQHGGDARRPALPGVQRGEQGGGRRGERQVVKPETPAGRHEMNIASP